MSGRAIATGWAAAWALAVLGLAGCQGVDAPYNQRLVVQVAETTGENGASANIQVDGKDVFGPVDLAPGERRNVPIHEPQSEAGPRLTPGQPHRISWRLEKKGMPGKAGDIEVKVFSGTNQMIASDSTKFTMPNIPRWWYVDLRLIQSTTVPPPPPTLPGQPGIRK